MERKEAIEVIKKNWPDSSFTMLREALETLIPELKESEENRIKSDIQYAVRCAYGDKSEQTNKILGWIEKQVPACLSHDDEIMIRQLTEYFKTGKGLQNTNDTVVEWLTDVKRKLEKQGDKDKLIQELGEYKVKYTQEVLEKHLKTINKDDERLRKTTIAFLKDFAEQGYENAVECIDWLEKHEQKPADKIEPKFKVKYAGSEYNVFEIKDIAGVTFYGIEDEPNHIDYVKAENCEIISCYAIKENGSPYPTKPAVFSEQKFIPMSLDEAIEHCKEKSCGSNACALEHKQLGNWLTELKELKEQKPAWSEEDEIMFRKAIITIDNVRIDTDSQEYYQGICDWLKSLKDRVLPQPKQEWNEEDEKEVAVLKAYIRSKDWSERHVDRALGIVDELVNKVKSLRPQNTWKPSEEQMLAINTAINVLGKGTLNGGQLTELLEQLKAL